MTREEKIENILENNWCTHERKTAAAYLWALYRNNETAIADLERFGDRPKQVFLNKNAYEHGLKFGFDFVLFDEHGWMRTPNWIEKEVITLDKDLWNRVEVAAGLNGKWTFGIYYGNSTSGGARGLSIYNRPLETKKQALQQGLEAIVEGLRGEKCKLVDACKSKLKELDEPEQFTLFDDLKPVYNDKSF